MQSVPINKEFEDQFIQSMTRSSNSQPSNVNDDFDPYLSQYAEYDSSLSDQLNTDNDSVQELGIPQYNDPSSSPPCSSGNEMDEDEDDEDEDNNNNNQSDFNNMTITPANLAKFSKYLNNPDAFKNSNSNTNHSSTNTNNYSTPDSSPLKSVQNSSYRGSTQTPLSSNCYTTPGTSPTKIPQLSAPYDSESESGMLYSSPESYSPNHQQQQQNQQNPDTSPLLHHNQPILTPNPNMTSSMDIYSSLDMSQYDPKSGSMINWQPVVTAPIKRETQEIIKIQQTTTKASSRKSCLPPGKVDSYLVGPNEDGMFECLFPNCGKFFRRRYNVRSHIQTHLCDRPYSCDECGACFVRPHDLRRHVKCHQSDRPFVCPCGKAFTRHDALQRHRIRLICAGGIEVPGRPKRVPAKRGRPRKNNPHHSNANSSNNTTSNNNTSCSESDVSSWSGASSPEMSSSANHSAHSSIDFGYDNAAIVAAATAAGYSYPVGPPPAQPNFALAQHQQQQQQQHHHHPQMAPQQHQQPPQPADFMWR